MVSQDDALPAEIRTFIEIEVAQQLWSDAKDLAAQTGRAACDAGIRAAMVQARADGRGAEILAAGMQAARGWMGESAAQGSVNE
jgi:hypothetical protein